MTTNGTDGTDVDSIIGPALDDIRRLHERSGREGVSKAEIMRAVDNLMSSFIRLVEADNYYFEVCLGAYETFNLLSFCIESLDLQLKTEKKRADDATKQVRACAMLDADRAELLFLRNGLAWVLRNAPDARSGSMQTASGSQWHYDGKRWNFDTVPPN